jgi:hypothetical protein
MQRRDVFSYASAAGAALPTLAFQASTGNTGVGMSMAPSMKIIRRIVTVTGASGPMHEDSASASSLATTGWADDLISGMLARAPFENYYPASGTAIPVDLDRLGEGEAIAQDGPKATAFLREFHWALQSVPVEDGYSHPAEDILLRSIFVDAQATLRWVSAAYVTAKEKNPSLAASIVRCIGRLNRDLVTEWVESLAMRALTHQNSEVREASIRAFEEWGEDTALELLQVRLGYEKAPWLREYLMAVIEDLRAVEANGSVAAPALR